MDMGHGATRHGLAGHSLHTPAAQTLPLPHTRPSGNASNVHPRPFSQASAVQTWLSSQTVGLPTHLAPAQDSPVVQASPLSHTAGPRRCTRRRRSCWLGCTGCCRRRWRRRAVPARGSRAVGGKWRLGRARSAWSNRWRQCSSPKPWPRRRPQQHRPQAGYRCRPQCPRLSSPTLRVLGHCTRPLPTKNRPPLWRTSATPPCCPLQLQGRTVRHSQGAQPAGPYQSHTDGVLRTLGCQRYPKNRLRSAGVGIRQLSFLPNIRYRLRAMPS